MKEELLNDLKNKFGLMVPEYNYQKNEGVHVGDGWLTLLEEMFGCIKHHQENLKTSDEYRKKVGLEQLHTDYDPVEFLQIKEKFGGMRCYYRGGDQYVAGVVHMTEVMSYRTCEKCGNPGEERNLPWIRTLCNTHYIEKQHLNNVVASHSLTETQE